MVDFEKQFERPDYAIGRREAFGVRIATTFKIVYGWMCAGLALSGLVAWYTATSGLYKTVLQGPGFMACVIAELVLVLVLSMAIGKMPVALAYLMFIGYAALNGLTLSVVFIAYELALVQRVFFITAGILRDKDPRRILIMGAAFAACYVFRVNAVLIILAAAAAGILCRRSGGSGRTGNGKEAA